ncbi:hypothetical protein TNCV_4750671 [Trichonephila clavipes]|nr:hypothetical protein TNCV_4750671 [Trichonephila clavipes]
MLILGPSQSSSPKSFGGPPVDRDRLNAYPCIKVVVTLQFRKFISCGSQKDIRKLFCKAVDTLPYRRVLNNNC